MAQEQCIARLGGWEGYEIEAEQDEQCGALRWCVIRLRPVTGRGRCCSGCGQSVPMIHDLEERRIRDLPVFESPVELLVPRVRAGLKDGQRPGPCQLGARARAAEPGRYRGHRHGRVRHPEGSPLRHSDRRTDAQACAVGGGVAAAVMDMNAGYELEVKAHCAQAEIVFDLFHVIAKYGREVIDRVRVDQANALRTDRRARQVVKGARWLLLKNRDSLKPGEDVELDELLAANHALFVVYVLRDALKQLWHYRHSGDAATAWKSWYRKALRSGIAPLRHFAQKLRPYLPGILAHCRYPLGTNLIEGINNKIKVIKRMAYGFRDDAYFFLKIRAAFPGVG